MTQFASGITSLLFVVTDALLVPTIVLLLLALVAAVLQLGELAGERWQRWRARDVPEFPGLRATALVRAYLREAQGAREPASLRRLARGLETEAARRIEGARLITRLGPTLGLIGTLIPMGPALFGLAQGDLGAVAENVRVAFATTVAGLAAGAVSFFASTVRRRWYAGDLSDIEYLCDRWSEEGRDA